VISLLSGYENIVFRLNESSSRLSASSIFPDVFEKPRDSNDSHRLLTHEMCSLNAGGHSLKRTT
jgi:hypothetical protein